MFEAYANMSLGMQAAYFGDKAAVINENDQ